ncbi:GumC family protein [Selenomonas sp. AE3005]|uniref:GumC family protein n=1 Tax=Selenomonas sp. AE3005 TaxID=1485543 RepID=UPI000488CF79|nr:GumC family protein [Selenomonas sp. AE3005]
MENSQEEAIDLGRLMQIIYDRRKIVGGIVGGCTALALIVSLVLPKTYESTTLVQTRSAGKDIGGAAAMAAAMGISIGGSSSAGSPLNYIELMKSRAVLEPVIDKLEWPDEKKKPDAKGFAKSALKIENTKQTNLITVTATGKTPEEAQMISQGVVDNFLAMQTDMNKQTQSILVKFLNERISDAKKDSDEAATKLAVYSKEHNIYAPDEQAQLLMTKLDVYDKAISDTIVEQKSAQAEYDVATAKIGQQSSSARAYNISDNAVVQKIRSAIVEKRIELVGYQQQFTDEHPSVVKAKEELDNLNSQLVSEVNAAVNSSGAASLSTTNATLLSNQAVAEAKASAAKASEAALREKKSEKETEMGNFPEAAMNFMQLKSDAKLKEEVYLNLVKECEKDKIQEAMESMDIQVIDPANLPDEDRPSGPRKKLITAIGFVIGCLISFGYGLICYKREEA